jgi:hypothetical protein
MWIRKGSTAFVRVNRATFHARPSRIYSIMHTQNSFKGAADSHDQYFRAREEEPASH